MVRTVGVKGSCVAGILGTVRCENGTDCRGEGELCGGDIGTDSGHAEERRSMRSEFRTAVFMNISTFREVTPNM